MGPLGRTRAWLLDIDGTLVFTDHLYRQVFEKLLSPLGYDVTDTFYAANVHGKVDADVFGKLLPEGTSQEELLAWSKKKDDTFCDLYREECARAGPPLLNGLGEALGIAQQTGVRCIAVTNAQRGAGEAAIASLRELTPAASIIEGLVIGAECEQAKPHPAPYFEGMRQLGVVPDDCIVFEDSRCARGRNARSLPALTPCARMLTVPLAHCRSGIRAGIAAGVLGVVGLRSTLTDDELRKCGCSHTLLDWTEITPDLVADLHSNGGRGTSPEAS